MREGLRGKRNWVLGLLGAVVLLLAGCIPTSENPIVTPNAKPDKALTGAWRGTLEDGGLVYLHFLRSKDNVLKAILITRENPEDADYEGQGEWAAFTLVTAKVAGTRYMSALFDYDDGEPVTGETRGYHLLRYTIAGDGTLSIFSVDDQALSHAVETGKLAGKIDRDQFTTDVRVTSPSNALVAYLKTIDPAVLFPKPFAALTRID